MTVFKRLVAGLALLLGVVGLLLSLAAVVCVWVVKGPVTARATRVFERVDAGLKVVDTSIVEAQKSLARAADNLEAVKEERKQVPHDAPRGDPKRLAVAGRVRTLAPDLSSAHEALHAVSDAAVVVNSVLEDVGNFPLLSESGLDTDELKDLKKRSNGVGSAAWELSGLLEGPSKDDEAGDRVSRIEGGLTTMRRALGEYHARAMQARQRTDALRSRVLTWITPAAVIFSLVCLWVALSQISVLSHAWSWWKSSGGHAPQPR
jgi:hypothetical protein